MLVLTPDNQPSLEASPSNRLPNPEPPAAVSPLLAQLATHYGVDLGFNDVFGTYHPATTTALVKVLTLLGVACDTPQAIEQSWTKAQAVHWHTVLEPVQVIRASEPAIWPTLRLPADRWGQPVLWHVQEENGQQHQGQWIPEHDANAWVHETLASGQAFIQGNVCLPVLPPEGYHTLTLSFPNQQGAVATSLLMRVPDQCYLPERLRYESGTWGPAVQLYGLQSQRNWGMGDFTDLRHLMNWFAHQGAGFVGLNPLHELFPHNPHHFSPYSPNSREYINSLYLDVEAVPEYAACTKAQALVASEAYQSALATLRANELVDYSHVDSLKRPVLELLFQQFLAKELAQETDRARAFVRFAQAGGTTLERFSTYQALQEHLFKADASQWGWPVWPVEYRQPDSPAVAKFVAENHARIVYYQYLQFLTDEQLRAAGDESIRLGMPVGLYLDVAVGANLSGADLWNDQHLYVDKASVGCPPDAFNQLGQDWGLPPIHPHRQREGGYANFIRMVRANMKYAGALRIDHALALFRIFWVPEGENGTNGAYVRFHSDELLGILALESHRNGCIVIGEDLGTIPDFVKAGLARWGALSYKVISFEKQSDTALTPPHEYPYHSLVTVSTHDLPTLAGFWQGDDIPLRQSLNLFPTPDQRQAALDARPAEKASLINSLIHAGLLDQGSAEYWLGHETLPDAVRVAVHRFLARTPSRLQAVQLEDLLGLTTQANMPGTTTEHPNWRRRLPVSIEAFGQQNSLTQTLAALRDEPQKAVRPLCCG
jgi:4-alpha-glucanotransferase